VFIVLSSEVSVSRFLAVFVASRLENNYQDLVQVPNKHRLDRLIGTMVVS